MISNSDAYWALVILSAIFVAAIGSLYLFLLLVWIANIGEPDRPLSEEDKLDWAENHTDLIGGYMLAFWDDVNAITAMELDGNSAVDYDTFDFERDFPVSLAEVRQDVFAILDASPNEVQYVLDALRSGRINGSTCEGECCCLVGTIASRKAEKWFMEIRTGNKPADTTVCRLTEKWLLEWLDANPATVVYDDCEADNGGGGGLMDKNIYIGAAAEDHCWHHVGLVMISDGGSFLSRRSNAPLLWVKHHKNNPWHVLESPVGGSWMVMPVKEYSGPEALLAALAGMKLKNKIGEICFVSNTNAIVRNDTVDGLAFHNEGSPFTEVTE